MDNRRSRLGAVAGLFLYILSAPALAQSVAETEGGGRIYSLTPEQKAELMAANTEASADAARAGPGGGPGMPGIHGEVGAVVGTGGARGIYGTAAIPLGENAGAVVSFESSRFGDNRRR